MTLRIHQVMKNLGRVEFAQELYIALGERVSNER